MTHLRATMVLAITLASCSRGGDSRGDTSIAQQATPVPAVPRYPAGLAAYQVAPWAELPAACTTPSAQDIGPCLQHFVNRGHVLGLVTLVDDPRLGLRIDTAGGFSSKGIFQIMSMTKPFVAVAIMKLVEQHRIPSVDARVASLHGLEDFPYSQVTLKQLLTHTSGVWYWREVRPGVRTGIASHLTNKLDNEPGVTARDKSLDFVARHYANPRLYPLGDTAPQYSNIGYTLLGWIVERVSGQPFDRYITSEILAPLGMTDTFFFPDSASAEQRARIVDLDRRLADPPEYAHYGKLRPGWRYPSPEGGLYSTAADLRQFMLLFRHQGLAPGHPRVLTPASVALLTQDQAPAADYAGVVVTKCASRIGRSLGFFVVRTGECADWPGLSAGSIQHDGRFSTDFWYDPVRDRIGVFLYQAVSNYSSTPGVAENDAFKQKLAAMDHAAPSRPNER